MKQLASKFVVVFGLLALAGCAAPGAVSPAGDSPEAQASARAEARWKAMIAKDFETAYGFLSPGSRVTLTADGFKGRIKPLDWRLAKVKSASCEKDACRLQISLTLVDKRLGGEVTTVFEENWLKDSGQWWLVYQ